VTLHFKKGGISIRIPGLTNKALGIKLVWEILNGKDQWWGEALSRKYLNCQWSKMLTEIIPDHPCTQIWKLIKKIIPQIRDHISKNPGNGKDTSTWNDRLMGAAPLNQHQNLRGLKEWGDEKGTTSLYSISDWEQNRWIAWRIQCLPID